MASIAKKDYLIGALAGMLTGFLALRIFSFLGIDFKFREYFFLLGIPIIWAFGVWLGGFLSRWLLFFAQFGKFAIVGFLGAAIDFSILNWISYTTGITAGLTVGWINIPGFFTAILNNYFWNKLWVFPVSSSVFREFPKFFGVTLVGLVINSSTIIILTNFSLGFDSQIWLNISKIVANALAMVWNFIGYKFIVFKKYV